MNLEEIWQRVLAQLQAELPRASFETWVRDAQALSLAGGLLTVQARNAYARDWLELRLTSTIQDGLRRLLNRTVEVRFVAGDAEEPVEEGEAEPQLTIEPVAWLDYDRIVQPYKQVVVKGYLRRLGREIGPKAVWLYIGFHQAAWKRHDPGSGAAQPLHSREVLRFSALSHGAFWRLLKHRGIQHDLGGLVQRVDEARRFRRGRDGRPHQAPVRYRVHMTPRLTRLDAAAIQARLRAQTAAGSSPAQALRELQAMDLRNLLDPSGLIPSSTPLNTVMDIVRFEAGQAYSAEVDQGAQSLHRRVIDSLGDIHIPHFFITHTIRALDLTPAQAWLVTVARDMAFINARTGERRELVTFKGGYREMAELVGSSRYKTVQAWLHPQWATQQRGGPLSQFLQEVELPDSGLDSEQRVDTMPRMFRVLLDEPLDANGSHILDATGTHTAGAAGSHRWTQMEASADAVGSRRLDADGTGFNSFKHPQNTPSKNTATTRHSLKTAGAAPAFWELESLLQGNDVHPKVQRELLETQASVHALVSWVLYVASPSSGNLSDPLGYALSRLREHPLREARGVFRQLADLPPAELLELIDATPAQGYVLPVDLNHPLAPAWKKAMGASNPRLPAVRAILFGEGACEPA